MDRSWLVVYVVATSLLSRVILPLPSTRSLLRLSPIVHRNFSQSYGKPSIGGLDEIVSRYYPFARARVDFVSSLPIFFRVEKKNRRDNRAIPFPPLPSLLPPLFSSRFLSRKE